MDSRLPGTPCPRPSERVECSAYDLSEATIGAFDVVVCGSLMLHLRDPLRALEAIRGVCRGVFLSAETIDAPLTILSPRRPALRFRGGDRLQWLVANAAAHRAMLRATGFAIDEATRPYAVPLGPGHPASRTTFSSIRREAAGIVLTRRRGVPHVAAKALPI